MDDICTYQFEVMGRMNENGRDTSSPLAIVVMRADETATLFTVCTDQSGIIGLIRYLHGRGYVFLSVVRE